MQRLASFDLPGLPARVVLMALAALVVLCIDWVTKHVAVSLQPATLVYHVSERGWAQFGSPVILVAAACSLLACVLPLRVVAVGAGAALGGALGNLTSRHWWSSLGGSPDFIPFADGSVGNLADVFIALGVATMLAGSTAWMLWSTLVRTRA
jgi:lipoprotein signal peptidase